MLVLWVCYLYSNRVWCVGLAVWGVVEVWYVGSVGVLPL